MSFVLDVKDWIMSRMSRNAQPLRCRNTEIRDWQLNMASRSDSDGGIAEDDIYGKVIMKEL